MLLKIFKKVLDKRKDVNLIKIGAASAVGLRRDTLNVVRILGIGDNIRILEGIPEEEMPSFYSLADVFVFPSKIEGFGLPLLEAMTCGAPVIASNRGSIPEVAGNAACLIDAEDSAALAGYLTILFTKPMEAERLRNLGYLRAAQYSWSLTAQKILAGYQMALAV